MSRRASRRTGWPILLALAVLLVAAGPCRGQKTADEAILDPEEVSAQYLLTLTGTVGAESFQGVRALLTISFTPTTSPNPYQILVVGYPTVNVRNCFNWNSEEGTVQALGSTVTSRVFRQGKPITANLFFYLSPVLLARPGPLTQHEGERRQNAEQTALPSRIPALEATLRLDVDKDRLNGRVTMSGLDPVGNTYVHYFAAFVGRRVPPLQTGQSPPSR